MITRQFYKDLLIAYGKKEVSFENWIKFIALRKKMEALGYDVRV